MVAILADIHSNLEAFKAVLRDMGPTSLKLRGVNEIWCLGDIVGYGPDPNECCQMVKEKAKYCVLGNHDAAIVGQTDLSWFNPLATQAVKINERILLEKNKEFLRSLPKKKKVKPPLLGSASFLPASVRLWRTLRRRESGEILLVHGSPQNPVFEYIFTPEEASAAFESFSQKICFVGHTHCPVIFVKGKDGVREIPTQPNKKISLNKNYRYLINPGAVGQPRDGDPRASYLLFDKKNLTLELRRIEYKIEKTQEKMERLGFPEFLIQRLAFSR